jgi:hypothetical protein
MDAVIDSGDVEILPLLWMYNDPATGRERFGASAHYAESQEMRGALSAGDAGRTYGQENAACGMAHWQEIERMQAIPCRDHAVARSAEPSRLFMRLRNLMSIAESANRSDTSVDS